MIILAPLIADEEYIVAAVDHGVPSIRIQDAVDILGQKCYASRRMWL